MRRRLRKAGLFLAGASALACPSPAAGQERPDSAQATPQVVVRAWVDRTAIWVGDRVTYTIDVRCPRGTDILEADLAKEKLKLDGLEVVSSSADHVTAGDGTTQRRVRHTLTSYTVDRPAVSVAPFTARYVVRRSGQRLEDATPAGEIQIPGATVALRSVLPDDQAGLTLRDAREPAPRPVAYRLARPTGLGLLLISAVPALVWTWAAVRRWWRRPARVAAKLARREERGSLEAVRALDVEAEDGRQAAYDGIDALVRRHLQDVCGVNSVGLTAAELADAVTDRRPAISADAVRALMLECERARFAPAGLRPTAAECRSAIEEAARLLSVR